MSKRILLTTLSTLGMLKLNYYYFQDNDTHKKQFCAGITAQEPGSFYALSKHNIDEIVVIGSKETLCLSEVNTSDNEDLVRLREKWQKVKENPDTKYNGLKDKWADLRQNEISPEIIVDNYSRFITEINSNTSYSDDVVKNLLCIWKDFSQKNLPPENLSFIFTSYDMFRLGVEQYLNGNSSLSDYIVGYGITDDRKRELKELLTNFLKDTHLSNTVKSIFLDADKQLYTTLKRVVADNITHSFEKEEDYEKYIKNKEKLHTKKEILRQLGDELFDQKDSFLKEEVLNDTSLYAIEKEYLLTILEQDISAVMEAKTHLLTQSKLLEITRERDELIYQIRNIKTHRIENELNYVQYLLYQELSDDLKFTVTPSKKLTIHFVSESTPEGYDNISEIVHTIQDSGENKSVELYIDMQGGNRTSSYVRNAILSILNNQDSNDIRIKQIFAINFNRNNCWGNEIADETRRYMITDLVSGMNAFTRYGKSDLIRKYCHNMGIKENTSVMDLVQRMIQIDEAISICDIDNFIESIKNLYNVLDRPSTDNDYVDTIFAILKDGIRTDYDNIIDTSSNQIKLPYLIEWCRKKGFIQQALVLIEAQMPAVYFSDDGILKPPVATSNSNREMEALRNLGLYYESDENKFFNNLLKNIYNDLDDNNSPHLKHIWDYMKAFCPNSSQEYPNPCDMTNGNSNNLEKNVAINIQKRILQQYISDTPCESPKLCSELKRKIDDFKTVTNIEKRLASFDLSEEKGQFDFIDTYYCWNCFSPTKLSTPQDIYYLAYIMSTQMDDIPKLEKGEHYFSFLHCCESDFNYRIRKNANSYIEITYRVERRRNNTGVDIYTDKKAQKVEYLFLLHEALKKERNNTNHASSKVRLSKKTIDKAIGLYKTLWDEL